jgi:hypothetical protein
MHRVSLFVFALLLSCRSSTAPTAAPIDAGVTVKQAPAARPLREGKVTDFHVAFSRVGSQIALRSFTQAGSVWQLLVDPKTLVTTVQPAREETPITLEGLEPSRWVEALGAARQHDASLQDSGLTHVLPVESGVVLTMDLCPSHKHFDFAVLQRVLDVFSPEERPVPIALAVSGVWLQDHADDLARLQKLDGTSLTITWINHSMHHRYAPRAPLTQNFLLEPGTDVRNEVLEAEVAMLERGMTPSIFFRFPGLVSEPALVETVTALGLVSVGSDAWLAKGERPSKGSIVLIHGNGNEPRGVEDFLSLLTRERRAISQRQFLLLDLRESVAETEP